MSWVGKGGKLRVSTLSAESMNQRIQEMNEEMEELRRELQGLRDRRLLAPIEPQRKDRR